MMLMMIEPMKRCFLIRCISAYNKNERREKKTSNEMVSLSKKDPRGLLLVLGILGICTCEQPIILIKTIYTKVLLFPSYSSQKMYKKF